MTTPKDGAQAVVHGAGDALVELSHRVHAHPELAFEEERSAAWLAEVLAEHDLRVETGVGGLDTAFVAEAGSGPLTIGICAEYDALPGIGHACGHNVIAAAAVGAGLALARVADEIGVTVRVIGTPAEELGGGKILLLERGVFDGVHAAMMVHPSPAEADGFSSLAVSQYDLCFRGRTAHASMAPHLGVNAADAITVAQVAIGLLRQHLRRGDQVQGIVTRGGEAANIVPGEATARYFVRAPDLERLAELEPRIMACFEAGALATGAALATEALGPPYSEFLTDRELAAHYTANATSVGRTFPAAPRPGAGGSTDMANVSLLLPTIHPMLGLDSLPAVNHQPEFAAFCATPAADRAVLEGATAMAWTAIDAATEPALRARLEGRDTSYGGRDAYPWRFTTT
ncbi:MAG: amidohydrolase [Acidimicrobiia bacterium]|nr:amidohydrolase [Acidimicrobiia bacterium]